MQETESRSITMDDDEPRALQALLRYIYTLDCKRIYRDDDPLFGDVERDLDVFVIADKYDVQELRDYMVENLVVFYETDKRPPLDPKGWSNKNQSGFGNILIKLYRLDMDTTDFGKAIVDFIIRGAQKVMLWEGVRRAIEEDGRLSADLIMAFSRARRSDDTKIESLEINIEDLQAELKEVREEKECLEAEFEYMEGIVADYNCVSPRDEPLYEDEPAYEDESLYKDDYYDEYDDAYNAWLHSPSYESWFLHDH